MALARYVNEASCIEAKAETGCLEAEVNNYAESGIKAMANRFANYGNSVSS
jgi:hypothetical protein